MSPKEGNGKLRKMTARSQLAAAAASKMLLPETDDSDREEKAVLVEKKKKTCSGPFYDFLPFVR